MPIEIKQRQREAAAAGAPRNNTHVCKQLTTTLYNPPSASASSKAKEICEGERGEKTCLTIPMNLDSQRRSPNFIQKRTCPKFIMTNVRDIAPYP